jgi:hypothetical protein
MSSPQEYWDACLIKTWRNDGKIFDAMQMFKSITGKDHFDYEPRLLRTPYKGMPWKIRIRVFAAQHLEKISARLWDQDPSKDVLLLKKLQTSSYDTSKQQTNVDEDLKKEGDALRKRRLRIGIEALAIMSRNRKTDWNIVK